MKRLVRWWPLFVLACAWGCGAPGPAPEVTVEQIVEGLTADEARTIIEASPEFRIEESKVHLLEWQIADAEQEGLWAIRRQREPDGRTRVTVEVLDGASPWLASAEYFAGGVVPLHLREPITRRIVEIVEIADAEFPQMKEIHFTWRYVGAPERLLTLKPELAGGPYPARARLQYQENSWRMVGHVRDSRISL